MPEGPEVQVVLSTLEYQIKGTTIEHASVRYPNVIEHPDVETFCQRIEGQTFTTFSRLGKYLIFTLTDYDLIVHLRMEGRFYIYTQLPASLRHIHVIFELSDGRYLCYHDTRKFGRMNLYPHEEDPALLPPLKNVGYDFNDSRLTWQYLYASIHSSKRSIKQALLDQSIIAGIGNIYADEICFQAQLDPRSRCYRISKKDCEKIVAVTRSILNHAIEGGGTTIRSYTSSLGVTGLFQLELDVHAQKGKACVRCGHTIDKITLGQRGTYLCRNCQKRK